jgi:uncharacterized protein
MPYMNSQNTATLTQFLAAAARPADTMSIHELRGFIWGVACAPTVVAEDEWLECIFDGEDPAFSNAKEEANITALLAQLMTDTALRMEDEESCFFTDEYRWHNDALERAPLTEWCLGLLKAHYWLEEFWNPLLDNVQPVETEDGVFDIVEEVDATLDVASLLADVEASLAEDEDPAALEASLPDMAEQISWIMMNYAECGGLLYEMDNAKPGTPYQREEPKLGRNDPCFCGSGKKFKNCCLNAANDD